jgi:TonB family protein
VEPKYPDAAKQAKVHGDVDILATIDPAGSVVDTEVLSGEEMLRQPAVDAAKQWKFRPVLRDGRAVYAYTGVHIEFSDPNNPDVPFRGGPDDAWMSRIFELMRTMPRTPQQELADLEQDLGPGTGSDREWMLPELAKAAIAAGALDKASSYANEMLKSDSSSPNYGQLHHDGHAMRGLVALRQGNVPLATQDLLEAGHTPGSAVLNSFGPNMRLAKELLEKGETAAVLEYFSRCKLFWKLGAGKLDAWSTDIRSGKVPDFGTNGVI